MRRPSEQHRSTNEVDGRSKWRSRLDLVAAVLCIVAALVVIASLTRAYWFGAPASQRGNQTRPLGQSVPTAPISLVGAPIEGNPNARVAIIEFSDFECPFCQKFSREVLPEIRRKYVATGEVLLAFRQFPLANHVRARPAAAASVCADRQQKFREMHDALFAAPGLSDPDLLRAAASIGLDQSRFSSCLDDPTVGGRV